jgi:uroporphyrinogen decarboxylase
VSVYLETVRGRDGERAPVWFMRQAGRYLPEYRRIRERHSFWEMVRTPELAAEVTLQPVERFGVDAAILFQDIMSPLPDMGVEVEFAPGPVIASPVRDAASVAALRVPPAGEVAPFAAEAVRLASQASPVPVIGFAGAPLTLAAYLVEGGGSKDFATFRAFLRSEPLVAEALLAKLADVAVGYLASQVAAGARAVQLFDSWAGLLDRRTYARHGAPHLRRIVRAVRDLGVPVTYMAVGAGHLLEEVAGLGCDAVSVDWRTPLRAARRFLPGKALQGNLDPAALFAPREALLAEALRVLDEGRGGPHVFNLGHGLLPGTDPDAVAAVVDLVKGYARRPASAAEVGA